MESQLEYNGIFIHVEYEIEEHEYSECHGELLESAGGLYITNVIGMSGERLSVLKEMYEWVGDEDYLMKDIAKDLHESLNID